MQLVEVVNIFILLEGHMIHTLLSYQLVAEAVEGA